MNSTNVLAENIREKIREIHSFHFTNFLVRNGYFKIFWLIAALGDGICESDQDCLDPEFNMCEVTESCLSLKYFPLAEFPNNTNLNFLNLNNYNCCRRRCYGNENPCDLGQKGKKKFFFKIF